MTFISKIFIALFGISLLSIINIVFLNSRDTFGVDFTPVATKNASVHIGNVFSEKSDFKSIDRNIERFLKRNNLAGASLAISENGQLKFAKGYGWADKERDILVQPYNLFRIASVSKLITATAIMKLVEDNKLKLDDKVFGLNGILNDAIFLEYKDKKVENITVKELLNHTSGWTNRWGDPMFIQRSIANKPEFDYPITSEDIIQFMLQKRLHYPPGTMSSYSNFGYTVLEKVIEKVSGYDYEAFVKTEILFPLEIFDMQLGGSYLWERRDLEVKYYEPDDPYLVTDHLDPNKQSLRSYGGNDIKTLGAAGGWISSSTDLLRFLASIDGFDDPQDILSHKSINEMTSVERPGGSPLGWRGVRNHYWYRTGTLAGSSALMVRYDNGISYVIIFNSSSWKGPEFANDIRKVVDKSLKSVSEWPSYNLFDLKINRDSRPTTIF